MRCLTLAFLLLALGAGASVAQPTSVALPRYPALSPDGKTMVFGYQGDLWSAPTEGGAPARRLTSHPAYESRPLFSPDGKQLAFVSNRFGRNEVFVMPAEGGVARRLTAFSGGSTLLGWAENGQRVLIGATRELARRALTVYSVANSEKPGRPRVVLALSSVYSANLSPDGKRLVFMRGSNDWPRVGYRGAANADLWTYDLATKACKRLTTFEGQDLWPLWLPDSRTVVYVSEQDGTYNLWKLNADGGKPQQLTHYKGEGVRFPTVSADGTRAAVEVEDRIDWVNLTGSPQPHAVALQVAADEKTNPIENATLTSGASELAPAPDGEQLAFSVKGELYAIPKEGGRAQRLTDAAARDDDMTWSPDGKTLVFVSNRDGNNELYALTSADTDEPKLARSLKRTLTRLTTTSAQETQPQFSPDGKSLAWLDGGMALVVADSTGKNPRVIARSPEFSTFSWSPDGKWLAYTAEDEEFNNEVYLVPADGSKPAVNVSRHPRNDFNPVWSPDGTKLFWASERVDRQFDLYWLYLKKDDDDRTPDAWQRLKEKRKPGPAGAAAPAPVTVTIDFDKIHERARRLTNTPGNEVAFAVASAGEGRTAVAFVSGAETSLIELSDGAPTSPPRRIAAGARSLAWTKDGRSLYLLTTDGGIGVTSAASTGDARPVAFRARFSYDRRELQRAVFEEAWETLDQQFYDGNFHGADWAGLRTRYRAWAAQAADPTDFYDVVRRMMGWLNSSHIAITPPADTTPSIPTGILGTIWDESYTGPGLKIARVIAGSPAARSESRLAAGELVTAINLQEVTADTDPDTLLADTVGERIPLQVQGADGKSRTVFIVPVASAALAALLYDEWVEQRRALTHQLSGGKLAYLHIRSMDAVSQDKFEAGLYAEGYGRDGLLVDVRNNGGGSTADYLLTMLSIPRHAYTIPRGGSPGYPQDRLPYYPWRKPTALLINQDSYSNAEIFAHAFRTIGRGPIIGTPTFGAVISTGARSLLDGSSIRTPGRGWYRVGDGVNEEHSGAEPDVRIEITPDDELAGRDPQLEAAVKTLLGKLKTTPLPSPKPARLSTKGG